MHHNLANSIYLTIVLEPKDSIPINLESASNSVVKDEEREILNHQFVMHLKSSIVVKQNIDQVIHFFYEPSSLAKWDSSVAKMISTSTSSDPAKVSFNTIAPSGLKMNYEVTEMQDVKRVKIQLKNSKVFKSAIWHFHFDKVSKGTRVTCHIHFTLRFLFLFLYPVLFFNKRAFLRDLSYFKIALNEHYRKK